MKSNLILTAALSLSLCAASTAQTLPAYLPTDGLVGWWPFNGNANDESGNGNNGVVNGATLTEDRFGNANSAYSFDGLNSIISINHDSSISVANNASITVQAWALKSGSLTTTHILGKRINGCGSMEYQFGYCEANCTNTFSEGIGFGCAGAYAYSGVLLENDVWNHYVGTFDGLNWKIYQNGDLIGTLNSSTINANLGNLIIGGSGSCQKWEGLIDDIAIYNRALTPEEITALYTGEPVNPPTACNPLPSNLQNGLVGYWPFCGNANDESGNGSDGTVNGATLTEDRFGNANAAYGFDGVDDWIEIENSDNLEIEEWSISVWYNSTDSSFNRLTTKSPTDGETNYLSLILADGKIYGSASSQGDVNSPLPIDASNTNDGTWHNAIYTRNGGNFNLFIDGINVSMVSDNFTLLSNNAKLLFGKDPTNLDWQFLNGSLDDIGIWNRALTTEEVQQLYTLNACTFTIYDTVTVENVVTVYDTVLTSVTDTLIINTLITELAPPANTNTIKVFPNPAGSTLTIDYGNFALMNGYQLRIENSLGQQVFQTNISQQSDTLSLGTWGGNGLYFVHIVDPQGNTVDIRKIILQ